LNGLRICRIISHTLFDLLGLITGIDHCFKRIALMFHIALCGFHQIGDQIVSSFQLHINLGKTIFESVSQSYQFVVNGYRPNDEYR